MAELERLCSSLSSDLALRIISLLPSPLLFECRSLCKAVHECAFRVFVRRPFFVYQKPSSECFLLPLDALSTPLPCSFKLGISSFILFSTSSNLICLQRRYQSMLDICICSIFCKWKVTLPPIVHPNYAPRLLRRVFTEDSNVDSLQIVIFESLPDASGQRPQGHGNDLHGSHVDTHAHACHVCLGSHNFRVVVVNNSYSRVFDSRQQEWSDLVYHLSGICPQSPSQLMVAGFPIKLRFSDMGFKLFMHFPHVEGARNSTAERGLILEGMCENGRGRYFKRRMDFQISEQHHHSYSRKILYNDAYDYQNQLYFLVVEKERITCYNRDRPMQQRNRAFHSVQPEDVEQYLSPAEGSYLACHQIFPALTPCMLTLYIAHVDTTNWTMQVRKENATALLMIADMLEIPYGGVECKMGKFLLIKGQEPC